MEKNTTLSNTIDVSEYSKRYDVLCKQILSEKIILAWIMKNTMEEFSEQTINDIVNKYIIGTPKVGTVPIEPDMTNTSKIAGTVVEDTSITEGTVVFDILFQALLPNNGEAVGLIINIEAQNDFYPGYPLVKRGIYYSSRMISSQYGTVFTKSDYGKIKKVYSVWICTNPPASRRDTITCYSLKEKELVGNAKEKRENYDLMSVIMICLDTETDTNIGTDADNEIDKNKGANTDNSLLKLLKTLLTNQESTETKKKILEEEYDIPMTWQMDRRLENMCNLSKGILEKGLKEGKKEGLKEGKLAQLVELVKDGLIGIADASKRANMTEQEFQLLLDK